jgi:3-isopropylmalate dehydrogenase
VSEYHIAVLAGDGIGPEVTRVAKRALTVAAQLRGGPALHFDEHDASAARWLQTGVAMPDAAFDACARSDAILLGAIGLPEARHPDGREVNGDVIFRLRYDLDLFAGIRPVRSFPGPTRVLANGQPIDYVIVRENTEGLYASSSGGTCVRGEVATDVIVVTANGTRRVCEVAFDLAQRRAGRPSDGQRSVCCVDKANVLSSYAFFRSVFDQVAAQHSGIDTRHVYVDAMTAAQVLHPADFDVVVAENMFGDIISDLGAATVGGLGLAPSADVGDQHGLFQPSHGSAPDIAGRDEANPLAAVLSAAMMADWLGRRHRDEQALGVASDIDTAVAALLAEHRVLPRDLGGSASTTEVAEALVNAMRRRAG